MAGEVRDHTDPLVRRLKIKISGCPNSCGQHWIADFGFYGNARKIDGKEVPYYLMLLGGGYDADGVMRFGLAVQSVPARLAPEAVKRVLDHYLANRLPDETFRDYVMRFKVEFFRKATSDLAKPAEIACPNPIVASPAIVRAPHDRNGVLPCRVRMLPIRLHAGL